MHGTLETIDDRPALRFERRLAHPVDAVWRAVTEPAELAHWFPSSVSGDVRVGGRLSFTFETDGSLKAADALMKALDILKIRFKAFSDAAAEL